jgi:hypothetical protein
VTKKSLKSQFFAFDDRLAKHGVPKLTKWWRQGIGEWLGAYEREDAALELWACVGRGSAKSTALYKLALFFTLAGKFTVPPGERHFAIILSRLKEEAWKGVSIISAWLTALRIRHSLVGDVIELHTARRGIRVVAASVAATSGWRAFFVGQDERSKWALSGVEEHDAEEIDTSATAMTATHGLAVKVTVGSAWGQFGGFYDVIQAGTNVDRVVLGPAPTWVAAPHISEASTRKKERDPRRWAREYACVFQADGLGVFDADAVERAMGRNVDVGRMGECELIVDPSSGKSDSWAWGIVRWVSDMDARFFIKFEVIDALEGRFWEQKSSDEVVAHVAHVAKAWGVSHVTSDQREAFTLKSAFARVGLKFRSIAWSSSEIAEGSKPAAIALVRRWLRDDVIILPKDEKLRREMLSLQERFSPSGSLTFGARGSSHDDRVAILITAAMADISRRIKPPVDPKRQKHIRGGFVRSLPFEERPLGSMYNERIGADGLTPAQRSNELIRSALDNAAIVNALAVRRQ